MKFLLLRNWTINADHVVAFKYGTKKNGWPYLSFLLTTNDEVDIVIIKDQSDRKYMGKILLNIIDDLSDENTLILDVDEIVERHYQKK